jgi:DNA-binding NarL/FixJ family response regulator
MARLLLVDDHEVVRASLRLALERRADFDVVEAGTLAEAREHLPGVDLVLLDLDLPDGNGLSLLPELHAANPEAVAVVLTASRDPVDYSFAIEQGAAGALFKAVPIQDIITAVQRAHSGSSIHTQAEVIEFLRIAARQRAREAEVKRVAGQLTRREHELLHALADGLSDKEIADRFSVSVRTVESHMSSIMHKLNTQSRLQTLITAARYGLIRVG